MFQIRSGFLPHVAIHFGEPVGESQKVFLGIVVGVQEEIYVFEKQVLVEEGHNGGKLIHFGGLLVTPPPGKSADEPSGSCQGPQGGRRAGCQDPVPIFERPLNEKSKAFFPPRSGIAF